MVLTKNVNGIVQEMSAKEEKDIKESWQKGTEKTRLKKEERQLHKDALKGAFERLTQSMSDEDKKVLRENFTGLNKR